MTGPEIIASLLSGRMSGMQAREAYRLTTGRDLAEKFPELYTPPQAYMAEGRVPQAQGGPSFQIGPPPASAMGSAEARPSSGRPGATAAPVEPRTEAGPSFMDRLREVAPRISQGARDVAAETLPFLHPGFPFTRPYWWRDAQPEQLAAPEPPDLDTVKAGVVPQAAPAAAPQATPRRQAALAPAARGGLEMLSAADPPDNMAVKPMASIEQAQARIGEDARKEGAPEWALPLVMAGLAMAASNSPNILQAAAEGGIMGIRTMIGERADKRAQQKEERAERKAAEDETFRRDREKRIEEMERERLGLSRAEMENLKAHRAAQLAQQAREADALAGYRNASLGIQQGHLGLAREREKRVGTGANLSPAQIAVQRRAVEKQVRDDLFGDWGGNEAATQAEINRRMQDWLAWMSMRGANMPDMVPPNPNDAYFAP